jgi:hypothetical protein
MHSAPRQDSHLCLGYSFPKTRQVAMVTNTPLLVWEWDLSQSLSKSLWALFSSRGLAYGARNTNCRCSSCRGLKIMMWLYRFSSFRSFILSSSSVLYFFSTFSSYPWIWQVNNWSDYENGRNINLEMFKKQTSSNMSNLWNSEKLCKDSHIYTKWLNTTQKRHPQSSATVYGTYIWSIRTMQCWLNETFNYCHLRILFPNICYMWYR